MRKTGVDVVGDIPWGTHFCLFYETTADLLDTLVPYLRSGLESDEFCLWAVAPPLTVDEALQALQQSMTGFERYSVAGSIEIVSALDWYLHDGAFELERVIAAWNQKLARASARGYAGVRVTGDTAWLEGKDWKDFCEYEESLNGAIANQHLAVLCTYPLAACGGAEILDVVRTHQFAVTRRHASWEVIETAGHKQAKAEIKRLNEELEQRVVERTSQLTTANEQLTLEVAERRCVEDTLRRTQAYLADAQRLTHTGSWGWMVPTRAVTHWSAECFRLYGFDRERGFPSHDEWTERVHPEDRANRREAVADAIRHRSDYELDYRIVLPDATLRYIHEVGHPLLDSAGELVEFVGTGMDVTVLTRAEEERERLRQTQADLVYVSRVTTMGELTASLAHETRQPIAAALLNARACRRWLDGDRPELQEGRDAAERMVHDIVRASEIIQRITNLFQKAAPRHESIDANQVILDIITLLRSEATRHSVSIRRELQPGLPEVMADRVQLQQVLMNLALNAIDAMKDVDGGRQLTIRSETGDGQLIVSCGDTGAGIPAQQLDRIFDPFFTTKRHGIGMGLAISRSIIESHRGRLWAVNNPGRGATFWLALPILAPAADDAATAPAAPIQGDYLPREARLPDLPSRNA